MPLSNSFILIGVMPLKQLTCLTPFLRTKKKLKLPLDESFDKSTQQLDNLKNSPECNSQDARAQNTETPEQKQAFQ